jgi:putative membrane protein
MDVHTLPALNATLNTAATIFLLSGWTSIKLGKRGAHATFMILSMVVSAAFLVSYLTYHFLAGPQKFHGEGTFLRGFYLIMLTSHVILAIVNVPLVIMTASRAAKQRFALHKKIAIITFPIWLYVSVTGVLVYFMCYVWYP